MVWGIRASPGTKRRKERKKKDGKKEKLCLRCETIKKDVTHKKLLRNGHQQTRNDTSRKRMTGRKG